MKDEGNSSIFSSSFILPPSSFPALHQCRLRTSRKLIHLELLDKSSAPSRSRWKTCSKYFRVASSSMSWNPACCQVSSSHSTMKVLVVLSNLYECAANTPAPFSRNVSVRPLKRWRVPYHIYLFGRVLTSGLNSSAKRDRTSLITPSAPTKRSYPLNGSR